MTSLHEIKQLVTDSEPDEWNHLVGWGSGAAPVTPAFLDIFNSGEYGQVDGWHLRNYSDVLVNEREVALSIAYGLRAHPDEDDNRREFEWAKERNWDVSVRIADVRWHGVPVDRVYYWVIDHRYTCPIGDHPISDDDTDDGQAVVSRYEMAVATAINTVHGVAGSHSYYFNATEQVVR
jgi:hypothetical protein